MVSGLFVGWTVHTGLGGLLAGVGLPLCSPSRCPGSGSGSGLNVPTVEVANQVIFTVLFPITFISNAFVAAADAAGLAPAVAEWNPTSHADELAAELWGNPNPYVTDSFPSQYPILVTLIWVVVFVGVFAPLGVRRYRNMSR